MKNALEYYKLSWKYHFLHVVKQSPLPTKLWAIWDVVNRYQFLKKYIVSPILIYYIEKRRGKVPLQNI